MKENDRELLRAIHQNTVRILHLLHEQDERQEQMAATINDILDDVTQETTLIDGLGTLIQSLKDQITAAQGDPAKIQAAFDQLEANKAKLAAALAANTPIPPAAAQP